MGKNILIIGHAFIVDENRSVWNKLLESTSVSSVDLLIPKIWKSNLVGNLKHNKTVEAKFTNIYSLKTYFTGNGSLYFYELYKTFKLFFSKKYDIIVINQESWALSLFFINIIRILTLNIRGKTFLMVAQNIKKKRLRWIIPLERFNLLLVDKILGCCNETNDVFRWKGIEKDWSYFPLYYSNKLRNKDKHYEGSVPNKFKLGYIGRISEEKGIESLLKAFDIIKKMFDVELVIAGAGDMVNLLNRDGIKYLGVLSHSDVARFYEEVDFIILPSLTRDFWKEQFGRVIVESVASGRLILGAQSGAIPEVMGQLNLENYLFTENDHQEIVFKIKEFIKNWEKNILKDHIEKAMKLNEQLFSTRAFVLRLEELINE